MIFADAIVMHVAASAASRSFFIFPYLLFPRKTRRAYAAGQRVNSRSRRSRYEHLFRRTTPSIAVFWTNLRFRGQTLRQAALRSAR
jgi:hypothetical protein